MDHTEASNISHDTKVFVCDYVITDEGHSKVTLALFSPQLSWGFLLPKLPRKCRLWSWKYPYIVYIVYMVYTHIVYMFIIMLTTTPQFLSVICIMAIAADF